MSDAVRALFLDRDGVINHDMGYTNRWEDFVFIDGIFDLCRYAKSLDYRLFVITNQAGIGRGLYTEGDFLALSERMCAEFASENAPIEKVYFSPFHPEHGIGNYKQDSFLRKPNPGMILLAAEEFGVSLPHSVLIGDKSSDIQAGFAAGVGINLLYLESGEAPADAGASVPSAVIDRLSQAKSYLRD
jgi:D-glycero-D-manno-heptose 1,7-bisphosphate phosphatase